MLDGPRIPPAGGKPARRLVVLLHGYGADGNDLIDIGRFWAPQMPETAFVAPNAPEPCPDNPMGRQWFPLTVIDLQLIDQGVQQAAPMLDAYLDAELAGHGLAGADLALVGFSQGTMMALEVGLRRPVPPAGIIGYSGLLAGPERLDKASSGKPPILLIHGEADPLVPVMALHAAVPVLGAAGLPVEWHVSPGLEHGIDARGLESGADFLRRVLG
ncbi:MAG: phospholipase [Hyphomicrobiales bacterium]|nr:phospholipase [Hyphomicrobiales bacterium]